MKKICLKIVKNTPGWCPGKMKMIPAEKLIVNRYTPVGEPPDFYEKMPHNGKREVFLVATLVFDEQFNLIEFRDSHGSLICERSCAG